MSAPAPRQLRARLRRARRGHHTGSLGDTLTDAYLLGFLLLVYGGAVVNAVRRYLRSPAGHPATAGERYWIAFAALVVLAALAWRLLRALGPLMATPAAQVWCVSSPVDRRGWLLPRLTVLLLVAGSGGAVAGVAIGVLALRTPVIWAVPVGALVAVAGAGSAVAAQAGRRRWPAVVGAVLTGVGVVVTAAVVAAHFGGYRLHPPGASVAPALAVLGVPMAVTATTLSVRALPRLDRAGLGSGAQLAAAATTAVVWLDPALLSGLLETRRWRRVGRVRSRRFVRAGRIGVLLQAEVRRQVRHPGALAGWAALVLAQYAIAVAVPAGAGVAHVVGGYLAMGRLTGGLRAVTRSPGLRRTLAGGDRAVRLAHLAVPAAGAALWWLVTAPAGVALPVPAQVVVVAGVVAAGYRSATRPPMTYGGSLVDTPFGLVPVDLIRQLARGPDLLAVLVIAQTLLR